MIPDAERPDRPLEPGRPLERSIERFLALNGYSCRRNAVLEGRSGGRHEVDVLAERSDGVTTYRLAVECKSTALPVDKEVVAKLSFVVRDLGVHQGVVASLRGSTIGAAQSARELGIELWGPAELEARLGRLALSDLEVGPPVRLGDALPRRCPVEVARRWVRQERRGWPGRRERPEWLGLVWVPHELLVVSTTDVDPGRFGRGPETATRRWNLYELVTGTLALSLAEPPDIVDEDMTASLAAGLACGKVAAAIRRAAERRNEVTTPSARARHEALLDDLGVPGAARAITVESVRPVAYPFYLALLRSGREARVVAVDGHLAARSPAMSTILTGAIDRVTQAVA